MISTEHAAFKIALHMLCLVCPSVCLSLSTSTAELSSRLDLASSEVAQMRDAVHNMAQRMADRDQAVAAELHTFQHDQLAKQQQQLAEARAAATAASAAADTLRDALLAIHTALSPHSLASALGFNEAAQAGLSLSPEGYEQLTSRLLGGGGGGGGGPPQAVSAADGAAVAARLREVLAKVRLLLVVAVTVVRCW